MNSAIADPLKRRWLQLGTHSAATTVVAPRRNVAVDAYRGLVMLLMMGEVMQWAAVSHAYPHSRVLAHPGLQSDARRVGGHVAA